MNYNEVKLGLIDWVTQLEDTETLEFLLNVKEMNEMAGSLEDMAETLEDIEEEAIVPIDELEEDAVPYFFDNINRCGVLVHPQQPFYEWLDSIFPEDAPAGPSEVDEKNIYLFREVDDLEEMQEWLKENYDAIFINELNDWYTDRESWPEERSFAMFKEWFQVEMTSMVIDMEEEPITKFEEEQ